MISAKTIEEIQKEQNGMCACGGLFCTDRMQEIHHIYSKNEYRFNDRDERWNLCGLSKQCHRLGKKAVHARNLNQNINHVLIAILKAQADKRKPVKERSTEKAKELKSLKIQRQKYRRKQLERFKLHHEGKTPWRYKYEKQKELKKKFKKVKKKLYFFKKIDYNQNEFTF